MNDWDLLTSLSLHCYYSLDKVRKEIEFQTATDTACL